MKIMMYKNGMERPAQPEQVEQFESAGWSQNKLKPAVNIVTVQDEIVLKPPVKSKSTAKTLDNANQQGEE
jgi:hypothetical protein